MGMEFRAEGATIRAELGRAEAPEPSLHAAAIAQAVETDGGEVSVMPPENEPGAPELPR